jgi:hypothetical protein
MSATSTHRPQRPKRFTTSPPREQGKIVQIARWGLLALLAGYLLFAHFGCHGDEDNELFAALKGYRPPASAPRR